MNLGPIAKVVPDWPDTLDMSEYSTSLHNRSLLDLAKIYFEHLLQESKPFSLLSALPDFLSLFRRADVLSFFRLSLG